MAKLKHEAGHIVLFGKLLQHVLCGGYDFALATNVGRWQAQMGEEHLAELLWRIDVEASACQFKDMFAYALQFDGEALRERIEGSEVDAHSSLFHAKENGSKRQIDIGIDVRHSRVLGLVPQNRKQRFDGCCCGCQCRRRSLPVTCCYICQRLRRMCRVDRVREQHCVIDGASYLNAEAMQDMQGELQVVNPFVNRRIFKQCPQLRRQGKAKRGTFFGADPYIAQCLFLGLFDGIEQ